MTDDYRAAFHAPLDQQTQLRATLSPAIPTTPAAPTPPKAKGWKDQFPMWRAVLTRRAGVFWITLTIRDDIDVVLEVLDFVNKFSLVRDAIDGATGFQPPVQMGTKADWEKKALKIVHEAERDDSYYQTDDEWYFDMLAQFLAGETASAQDVTTRDEVLRELRSSESTKHSVYCYSDKMLYTHTSLFATHLKEQLGTRENCSLLASKILEKHFTYWRHPKSGVRNYWHAPFVELESKGFTFSIDPETAA